ncbi:MAG: hypothetical protein ACPGUD_06505 [Parashewanella sp.]
MVTRIVSFVFDCKSTSTASSTVGDAKPLTSLTAINGEALLGSYDICETSFSPAIPAFMEGATNCAASGSCVFSQQAHRTKIVDTAPRARAPLPSLVVNLLGHTNPAYWQPEQFVEQLIERTKDTLSWQCSQVYLKNLREGTPLPIPGFHHTCQQMRSIIEQFLLAPNISADDKHGLKQFITMLDAIKSRGYPYKSSVVISTIFPLVQQFFYFQQRAHLKWKHDIEACDIHLMDQRYRNIGLKQPDSIKELLKLPWETLFDAKAIKGDTFDSLVKHVCAITGNESDPSSPFSVKNYYKNTASYFSRKVIFSSFSPLNIKNLTQFSFLPFVPIGFLAGIWALHDNVKMSCGYFPIHDGGHEAIVKSHDVCFHDYNSIRCYYEYDEVVLPNNLKVMNRQLLFFWFHDTDRNSGIYCIQELSNLGTLLKSLEELVQNIHRRWTDFPAAEQALIRSDCFIQAIAYFSEGIVQPISPTGRLQNSQKLLSLLMCRAQLFITPPFRGKVLVSRLLDKVHQRLEALKNYSEYSVKRFGLVLDYPSGSYFIKDVSSYAGDITTKKWSAQSNLKKLHFCYFLLSKNFDDIWKR